MSERQYTPDTEALVRLRARIKKIEELGWVYEDTRLTPGIPTYGLKGPEGQRIVLGWLHNDEQFERALKIMDERGVP